MYYFDFEAYLRKENCINCGHIGMVADDEYTYHCPKCGEVGFVNPVLSPEEEWIRDHVCPECGGMGQFELNEEDCDLYKCTVCGHEGSIQEDKDMADYADDMLSNYDEEDRDEVWDGFF